MSHDQAAFSFELNESLFFRQGQEVAEMVGISLEPIITIHPHPDYVQLRGVIELKGQYRKDPNGHADYVPLEDQERHADRFVEIVEEAAESDLIFAHQFPIEISIPAERIFDLEDIRVQVESFDYVFPANDQLRLNATVQIHGIQPYEEPVEEEREELASDWSAFFEEQGNSNPLDDLLAKLSQPLDELDESDGQFEFEIIPQHEDTLEADVEATATDEIRKAFEQAKLETSQGFANTLFNANVLEADDAEAEKAEVDDAELLSLHDPIDIEKSRQEEQVKKAEFKAEDNAPEHSAKAVARQEKFVETTDAESKQEVPAAVDAEEVQEARQAKQNNSISQATTSEAAPKPEEVQEADSVTENAIVEAKPTIEAKEPAAANARSEGNLEEAQVSAGEEVAVSAAAKQELLQQEEEAEAAITEVEENQPELESEESDLLLNAENIKKETKEVLTQSVRPQAAYQQAETEIHALPDEEGADLGNLTDLFGGQDEEEFTRMRLYIVQDRDTLETIADRYQVPITKLLQHNRLETDNIGEGQLIYIPYIKETKA